MLEAELIQRRSVLLQNAVERILKKFPLDPLLFRPLIHLAEFLAAEEKFLARMRHKISECRAQIRKLLLVGLPGNPVHE